MAQNFAQVLALALLLAGCSTISRIRIHQCTAATCYYAPLCQLHPEMDQSKCSHWLGGKRQLGRR